MTIPVLEYDACLWPVDTACFTADWEALDPATQDRALALASSTLNRLTGYRVGGCPILVRPCKASCAEGWPSYAAMYGSGGSSAGFSPVNYGGVWVNSCGCSTACGCSALCEINLPGPVGEVYEVTLDGQVVNPDNYRVDNGTKLVWVGVEECPWPTCQDLAAPLTEANTFGIEYLNSYPVDALGAYAAAILAMEYAKACTGAKCRLPAGVTSVSRQGVSFEITSGAFPGGMTGIREVDTYIALWNPEGLRQSASVWFPGKDTPRVTR